jgi:multicomponent Na+:H+ antiporter subunit D
MTTSQAASLLPLAVVLPITGAVMCALLALLHRLLPLILSTLVTAGTAVLLLVISPAVYAGSGSVISHYLGHWGPVNGAALGIAFAADPFGMTFAIITGLLGTLLLIYIHSELGHLGKRELGFLTCLVQLLLAAIIGTALTADTINMFVWFEVAALASYGLTGFFLSRPPALEAAFKILVLTSIAGFAVFVGAGILYSDHGALNFGQLHRALASGTALPDMLALAMLIGGYATKAGLMPFHGWLPDAHTAPHGAVSALFSALMVDIGILAIARLLLQVYPRADTHSATVLLTVLGAGSALLGAVLTLAQDDLKRLLAWDTVSQMGVLVLGFATANESGVAGAAYHMVNHALFKAMLFLCAGTIVHTTGKTALSEMGGLARRRPLLAGGFTNGVMAISGIPPMNGYASLGLVHEGLMESGQWAAFAVAELAQIVTIAALCRAGYLAFFRRRAEPYEHLEPTGAGSRFTVGVLAAGCVAFGVLPGKVIRWAIAPAASSLLHPELYADAVLGGVGRLPQVAVGFDYGSAKDLGIALASVAIGLALAAVYLRIPEPAPVRWLRAVHTGSVNDYTGFLAIGLFACALVLML